MAALPKKKISRRRRDNRRSHSALTPVVLIDCPNCRRRIPQFRACPHCGQYRGRQVIQIEASATVAG